MRSLCSYCDGIGWMCRDAEGNLRKYDAPGATGTAIPCKCQKLAAQHRESKHHPKKSKKHLPEPPSIPDRKSLAAGN